MKLDFDFSEKTLLKDWWKQVKANFQTVQESVVSHVEEIYTTINNHTSEEKLARVAADKELDSKIETEKNDRLNECNALTEKIDDEIKNRNNSETAIYDAYNTLDGKISDEETSRKKSDDVIAMSVESLQDSLASTRSTVKANKADIAKFMTLYNLLIVNCYDGGGCSDEYDSNVLDGGDFSSDSDDVFDCGGFLPTVELACGCKV